VYCSKCGAQIPDNSASCQQCGTVFGGAQPANWSAPQQPWLPVTPPGDGAATVSLICGIIGFFFAGLILGIVSIVQGAKAKRLGYTGGKATAGIVLGIIDLAVWAILIIIIIAAAVLSVSAYSYF